MPGQIDRIMAGLHSFIEGEVSGLARDLTNNLVNQTPRRTGWAAESWLPNIGGPPNQPIQPAGHPGTAKSRRMRAEAELPGYRLTDGPVHIVNTSGYVLEIETRQPFIEDAIDSAIAARQAASPVRFQRRRRQGS